MIFKKEYFLIYEIGVNSFRKVSLFKKKKNYSWRVIYAIFANHKTKFEERFALNIKLSEIFLLKKYIGSS